MTTSVLASSGGDYATRAAWEAAISANPTVEQIGEQRDGNDLGNVTINVSNSNAVEIRLTVQGGNGYRFNEQAGWPNCKAVEGSGARYEGTGNGISVATNNVIVEWLMLSPTTSGSNYGVRWAAAANNVVFRNLALWNSRSDTGNRRAMRGSYDVAAATTNLVTVQRCFIWGANRAIWAIDNATTIENVTIHCAGMSPSGSFGINKQNNGGTGNTVIVRNCKVVGRDLDACYVETTGTFDGSSDKNIDSDGTAPGTTTYTLAPEAAIYNPNLLEEDLHGISAALGREWPASLDDGWSGEGNDSSRWTTTTNLSATAGAAYRGSVGIELAVTSSGSIAGRFSPNLTSTTTYAVFVFRLRSGWTMGTGETFDFFETRRSGGAQVSKMRLTESGGSYLLEAITLLPTGVSGSSIAITPGTWYVMKTKTVFEASGETTIWVGPAGGSLTQLVSDTGDMSGFTYARFDFLSNGIDVGTVGTIDADQFTWSPTDHEEADDATSPYGTDNDGLYIGSASGHAFDIDGNAVDTDDIGAHDYSVASSSTTVNPTGGTLNVTAGSPVLSHELAPTGAQVLVEAGSPNVALGVYLNPNGASVLVEAGAPTLSASLAPAGAAVLVQAGDPSLAAAIAPSGAAVLVEAGDPAVLVGTVTSPAGAELLVAAGSPTLTAGLHPAGAAVLLEAGAPHLDVVLRPAGAEVLVEGGDPALSANVLVTPTGAEVLVAAGSPTVTVQQSPIARRLRTVRAGHLQTRRAGHVATGRAGYLRTEGETDG